MFKKKKMRGREGPQGDLGKKEGVRPARGGELKVEVVKEKVRTSVGLEIKQSIFLHIKSLREVDKDQAQSIRTGKKAVIGGSSVRREVRRQS